MASGINNTFRQLGIATGIAALGAIFSSTVGVGQHDADAATSSTACTSSCSSARWSRRSAPCSPRCSCAAGLRRERPAGRGRGRLDERGDGVRDLLRVVDARKAVIGARAARDVVAELARDVPCQPGSAVPPISSAGAVRARSTSTSRRRRAAASARSPGSRRSPRRRGSVASTSRRRAAAACGRDAASSRSRVQRRDPASGRGTRPRPGPRATRRVSRADRERRARACRRASRPGSATAVRAGSPSYS